MFERFTSDARTTVVHAQQHARRLGHRFIGCEHLLLAVAGSADAVGEVLRDAGVTPEQVELEIVRQVGLGAGAGLFADLDREALAAVGIDLDAVRARVEARFGSDALVRADERLRCRSRRQGQRGLFARLWRRLPKRRRTTGEQQQIAPATGRFSTPGAMPTRHLPFTARAKRTLENGLHEALSRHDSHIGVEHIALGLLGMDSGTIPPILSALGTSPAILRAAIRDRYRRIS